MHVGYLEDGDDAPMVALALADLLLDGGGVGHPLPELAGGVSETGAGLERWQEAGAEALAERVAVDQRSAARLPQPPSSGSRCLCPPPRPRLPLISFPRTAPRPS